MSSTTEQIDDAVARRHTQNTDTAAGAQSADLDMNLHKIIGLADPTGDKDGANKEYVDTHGGGGGSPGGADTHIQFNDGGALGGDVSLTWLKTTNNLNLAEAEIQSVDSTPGNFSLDSSPLVGAWAGWTYRGANVIKVRQAEVLPTDGTSHYFVDGLQINHCDTDVTNYESSNTQHEMHAVNIDMTGTVSSIQYKDMIGLSIRTLGRTGWADRGVSAITNETKQFGEGIAANEFHVFNPANAEGGYEQSRSMAGLQIVMKPHMGDEDATHIARGLMVNNFGKRITSGVFMSSHTDDYGSGHMKHALSMDNAIISTSGSAILMPQSESGNVGTVIEYNPDDYTYFDRAANRFGFVVGGTARTLIDSYGLDMNSHKIANVLNPTNPQDAATKAYVDGGSSSPYYTIVAMGQSNMVGYSGTGGDKGTDSRVTAWNGSAWVLANLNNAPFSSNNNNIAFHYAKQIAERFDRNVRIILEAENGRPIGDWVPDTATHYAGMRTQISASGTTKVDVVLWHQGESDYARTHAAYGADLNSLCTQLRGEASISDTMPIVMGELLCGGIYEEHNYVYERLADYVSDRFVSVAKAQFLPNCGSYIHFTGDSLVRLGRARYFEAMNNMISKPVGRTSIVKAKRTADQIIAHNTWTIVQLNLAEIDEGPDYDTGTYRFTAYKSGFYNVVAQIQYGAFTADSPITMVAIFKNGARTGLETNMYGRTDVYVNIQVSGLMQMYKGDYLDIRTFQYSGANQTLVANGTGETNQWFMVNRIMEEQER